MSTITAEELNRHLGVSSAESEMHEIPPSLEDVFVTLTMAAEADRRTSQETSDHTAHDEGSSSSTTADGSGPTSAQNVPPSLPTDKSSQRSTPSTPGQNHGHTMNGLWAVLVKEFVHVRRQPTTLFFMLVVPVMQTIIFGYAIDTQIENIPLVVFDLDGRQQARDLTAAFANTRRFRIIEHVSRR